MRIPIFAGMLLASLLATPQAFADNPGAGTVGLDGQMLDPARTVVILEHGKTGPAGIAFRPYRDVSHPAHIGCSV